MRRRQPRGWLRRRARRLRSSPSPSSSLASAPSPRCYNTLFITGGTTSRPTTDTLSVTTAKAAFSHSSCPAWEANRAACLAELEAKKATLSEPEYEAEKAAIIDKFAAVKAKVQPLKDALEADHKIWKAKMDKDDTEFRFFFRILLLVFFVFATIGMYNIIYQYKRNGKGKTKVTAASDNTAGSESCCCKCHGSPQVDAIGGSKIW